MIEGVQAIQVSTPTLTQGPGDAQLDLELSGGPAGPLRDVPLPTGRTVPSPSPDPAPGAGAAPTLDEGAGRHRLHVAPEAAEFTTGHGAGRDSFIQAVGSVDREYQSLQAELHHRVQAGSLSNEELLLFQMRFQLAVQQVEMMSKTVEQSVTGLKTVIQTRD